MTLEVLLAEQRDVEFWGCRYDFEPRLIDRVFGDGKQLIQVFPIMERPRYWVLRADSACTDDDAFLAIVDDVVDAIDEQFGCPDGVGDDRPYFPMIDGDGVAWHFVKCHE